MNVTLEREDRVGNKDAGPPQKGPKTPPVSSVPNLGKALRTVYDQTLREDVPSDLMELLGKLS